MRSKRCGSASRCAPDCRSAIRPRSATLRGYVDLVSEASSKAGRRMSIIPKRRSASTYMPAAG